MTKLHNPLEFWGKYLVPNVSKGNGDPVSCDEDNEICQLYYRWSTDIFQRAAKAFRYTANNLMENEIVKSNEELKTQIWDAFGEFYQAIQKVDEELILAIYHKKTELIEAPVSSFSTNDPPYSPNPALVVEKLWSEMKSIMKQAIEKMSPGSKWRVLFENLIKDGERISSKLLSLLKENI